MPPFDRILSSFTKYEMFLKVSGRTSFWLILVWFEKIHLYTGIEETSVDASRGEITGEGDVILTWKSIIKPFAALDFVLT